MELKWIARWGGIAFSAFALGFEFSMMCAFVWLLAWLMVLASLPGSDRAEE